LNITEKASKLAESIAKSRGLEIVQIKYSKFGRRGLLRVFIAKPGGVSINDCSGLSRELEFLLEAEGVIDGPYTLEVSSPGLDRPLKSRRDFARNTGNRLKVEYQAAADKITTFSGNLKEVINEDIILENNGQTHSVSLASILKAKIEVQF